MRQAHLWFPLSLGAFSFVGLVAHELRKGFALVAFIVTAGLALAELYLATDLSPGTAARVLVASADVAHARGETPDQRDIRSVVLDLRRDGRRAYPASSAYLFLENPASWSPPAVLDGKALLPLSGVRHADLVHCNEDGGWFVFRSDRYGFNNPDALWDGEADLLLVGDSFAIGACNSKPGVGLLDRLRTTVPKTISIGAPNAGALLQLALFKEYGALTRPRNIVWLLSDFDVVNFGFEIRFEWLRDYLQRTTGRDLPHHQDHIDATIRKKIDAGLANGASTAPQARLSWSETLRLLHLRNWRNLTLCPARTINFDALRAVFEEARAIARTWGGRLTVAYMPSGIGAPCDLLMAPTREASWLYDGSLRALERAGIRILNLRDRFTSMGYPRTFYFFAGSHPSEAGAQWFSSEILSDTRRNESK